MFPAGQRRRVRKRTKFVVFPTLGSTASAPPKKSDTSQDPAHTSQKAIRRLRPNPLADFELRVGDLRALYAVEDAEVIILIVVGRPATSWLWRERTSMAIKTILLS